MLITPSVALKQSTAALWLAALDNGAGPATMEAYTGSKPTGPDVAVTSQVLLGTLTCSGTTGTVTTVGDTVAIVFGAVTQDTAADNGGTVTWIRIKDGAGTPLIDVDASDLTGNGFAKFNTSAIVQGGPISLNSCTIVF